MLVGFSVVVPYVGAVVVTVPVLLIALFKAVLDAWPRKEPVVAPLL